MGDSMNLEHADVNYWNKDGYFVQKNIKVFDNDQISAKIDGKWQNYVLKSLPDKFMKWSVDRRISTIEDIKKENARIGRATQRNGCIFRNSSQRQ